MAPTRQPPDDKREAILDAALDLFAEEGYAATAVPTIAKRAGVGAGTIYRYFESKEGVVNALYRDWKERLTRHMLEGFPQDGEPRDQLAAFCSRLASFVDEHPEAFAFLELHHHRPYIDARAMEPEERLRELARELIESHQRHGTVTDLPPDALMAVIYGAVTGLLKSAARGHVALTEETLTRAVDRLWEAVRGGR